VTGTPARPPGRLFLNTDVVPLTSTCLCLLTRISGGTSQVLLGHKKRGLGAGKIVGLGGHVEPGETPAQAAARETKEEAGIDVAPDDLSEAAHLTFIFPVRPEWDMTVAVFTAASWTGEATVTTEITPEWFPFAGLPLDRMWDDARYWLPRVLAGERVRATFTYADDCDTVADSLLAPPPPPPPPPSPSRPPSPSASPSPSPSRPPSPSFHPRRGA
jgi:8-oxo-dGTP diphosphatase